MEVGVDLIEDVRGNSTEGDGSGAGGGESGGAAGAAGFEFEVLFGGGYWHAGKDSRPRGLTQSTDAVTVYGMAVLRLGTRASHLALAQSGMVARRLEALHAGLTVELVHVKTTGDRVQDRPLQDIGGKGLFTKELELALLAGTVDFAVHSLKDVPVTEPLIDVSGLVIAAVPPRADARDALVLSPQLANEGVRSLAQLPETVRVGTSSLRRACQVRAVRPEAHVLPLRGNIDTRLWKVREGEYDAILLAMAGLARGGFLEGGVGAGGDIIPLATAELLPAAGQGALAIQAKAADKGTQSFLAALNDPATQAAVADEREMIRLLGGDCHSPIAAYSSGGELHVRIFARDGMQSAEARGPNAETVFAEMASRGHLARLGYAKGG